MSSDPADELPQVLAVRPLVVPGVGVAGSASRAPLVALRGGRVGRHQRNPSTEDVVAASKRLGQMNRPFPLLSAAGHQGHQQVTSGRSPSQACVAEVAGRVSTGSTRLELLRTLAPARLARRCPRACLGRVETSSAVRSFLGRSPAAMGTALFVGLQDRPPSQACDPIGPEMG